MTMNEIFNKIKTIEPMFYRELETTGLGLPGEDARKGDYLDVLASVKVPDALVSDNDVRDFMKSDASFLLKEFLLNKSGNLVKEVTNFYSMRVNGTETTTIFLNFNAEC
jgi:hypothetical protein